MVEIDIVALTNSVKEEIKNNTPEKGFARLLNAGIIDKEGNLTPYYRNDDFVEDDLKKSNSLALAH